MIRRFGSERIAQPVDRVTQVVEDRAQRREIACAEPGLRYLGDDNAALFLPAAIQHQPVDDVVRGDAVHRGRRQSARASDQWRDAAKRGDEAIHAPPVVHEGVVEATLDAVAEQRAERLPLPHAFEQTRGLAHAARGEIDGKGSVGAGYARRPQMGVAQQCRRCGVRHRRRVNEAAVVGRRLQGPGLAGWQRRHRLHHRCRHRLEILDPAVGADVLARRTVEVHRGEPLGGDGRHPGVEPMRREIERALHQMQERFAVETGEIRQAGAELTERRQRGSRERGLRLEVLANLPAPRRGQRLLQLPCPVHRRRRAGDEIDELRVAQKRGDVGAGFACLQLRGGERDLPEHRVAQQHLQQARRARGLRVGPRDGQLGDVQRAEQRRDVVGLERGPRRDLASLDQRRRQVPLPVSAPQLREARPPREAKLLQERGLPGIAVGHGESHESMEMLKEMTADHAARVIGARERVGPHHVGEIGVRIDRVLPAADAGNRWRSLAPHAVTQRQQHRLEPCVLRRHRFAGARLPQIERSDRQDAVGLRAAAHRRKRSEAAHVIEEVASRPVDVRRFETGFGADHVAEEVAPADLPERRVHAAHVAIVTLEAALDAAERGQDAIEGQPQRGADAQGVVVVERRRPVDFDGEAARVSRIARAVAGAPIVGVVARRARPHEREPIGVVMRVEQIGELRRGVGDGERPNDAEHDEAVQSGCQRRRRNGNAQGHARLLGLVEVGHPFHAGVDRELLAVGDCRLGLRVGRRRLRIRADGKRPLNVPPGDGQRHLTAGMHDRDPAIGHQARLRCVTPGFVARRDRDRGEHRTDRGRTLCRIRRLQHARDPGGTLVAESIGDLPPCGGDRFRVALCQPVLLPVMLSPHLLVGRQVALVAVEVNLVGEHAHAQLGGSVREREEACLQSDRQQHERQVAGTERRRRGGRGRGRQRARVRARRRYCETALEQVSHGEP